MADTANVRNVTTFTERGDTDIGATTLRLNSVRRAASVRISSVTMIMKAWSFVNGFVDHATEMPGAFIESEFCQRLL